MAGTLADDATDEERGEHEKRLAILKRFTSPAEAAKKIREQEKFIASGAHKKPLPAKATPEQIAAWRAENGVPLTADKYDLTLADAKFDETDKPVIDTLVAELHATHASPDQVKGALKAYAKIKADQVAAAEQRDVAAKKVAEDTLREEWGADYRPNVDATKAMLEHAGDEVAEAIFSARMPDGSRLAHSPALNRWLAGHARELGFVPGAITLPGGDIGAGMQEELDALRKEMGKDIDAWRKNEKGQQRFMALTEAMDRINSRK